MCHQDTKLLEKLPVSQAFAYMAKEYWTPRLKTSVSSFALEEQLEMSSNFWFDRNIPNIFRILPLLGGQIQPFLPSFKGRKTSFQRSLAVPR